ncbi:MULTISPECIES: nuclear transport factor 2 family protein [unclassified Microbacterium]|uniref:YybH family protein n=1 Tax=unclassified Microbacterium TaxID=2609290 RepID=UPI00214CC5BF|nr:MULTISPECIES: nuclear transport factor 2 family protein [unclassified Microbacterium]MCR2810640.1 nuclear transport factor 2 family protein [Microbacterium sp. zg.B185]WIM18177.1 nuclear transport factor 2 family protein [Microbacterium sp. zg-B185]
MTAETDREEILTLHKDWWEANHQLIIPQMQSVYPTGDSYLMFNANGHPYFGIDEKTALWEWYQREIEITGYPEIKIMRLTVSGDMAWLACEGVFPMRAIGSEGTGSATWEIKDEEVANRLRATEIYQRDDGDGNPVWKMWHFHASPLPDADEPRPAFGDTPGERGLGAGPGITPLRVTSEGVREG